MDGEIRNFTTLGEMKRKVEFSLIWNSASTALSKGFRLASRNASRDCPWDGVAATLTGEKLPFVSEVLRPFDVAPSFAKG